MKFHPAMRRSFTILKSLDKEMKLNFSAFISSLQIEMEIKAFGIEVTS
jgi:hypothetical protein